MNVKVAPTGPGSRSPVRSGLRGAGAAGLLIMQQQLMSNPRAQSFNQRRHGGGKKT